MFPAAHILGCSTGGQINNSDISDDEIVAAAISFDATRLQLVRQDISDAQQSRDCGETIGRALRRDDLAGIFVLSDGLNVNGSELVGGLVAAIGPNVPLTGGLAGDGADFAETLVGGDCAPRPRTVVGVGFYGSAIRIGHGSAGGWDLFGPRRQVTKSIGNVLYSNSTDSPLLTCTSAIWGLKIRKGSLGQRYCFRSRFTMPIARILRWYAPFLRSITAHGR